MAAAIGISPMWICGTVMSFGGSLVGVTGFAQASAQYNSGPATLHG
jgi:hypothetical protein